MGRQSDAAFGGPLVKQDKPLDMLTLTPLVETGQHSADRARERFHRRRRLLMGGRRLGLGAPARISVGADGEYQPLSGIDPIFC